MKITMKTTTSVNKVGLFFSTELKFTQKILGYKTITHFYQCIYSWV